MYLEISNVAAALGKNPYESRQKTLLVSWARHCPRIVRNYLIENGCIIQLKDNEETFSELRKEIFKNILPEEFDVEDFSQISENVIKEYKLKRDNKQSDLEISQLKEYTTDCLNKNNGNIQENNIIKSEKYEKGNNKMYYFEIYPNALIGGKHDASINETLIEIKTRVKRQNIRRNEYDLYQLICYLLATGNTKGKIVQLFNKQKFDSDIGSEYEYGLVDLKNDEWNILSKEIINNLRLYFDELAELINSSKYLYLTNIIPLSIRPIAKYTVENEKIKLYEENIKFRNLLNHISKN